MAGVDFEPRLEGSVVPFRVEPGVLPPATSRPCSTPADSPQRPAAHTHDRRRCARAQGLRPASPSGSHSAAEVSLWAPAAGPPPANRRGRKLRGSRCELSRRRSRSDRLRRKSDPATARFSLTRPGRSVPTREAARRRGGL